MNTRLGSLHRKFHSDLSNDKHGITRIYVHVAISWILLQCDMCILLRNNKDAPQGVN